MIFERAAREPDGIALDDLERRFTWAQLEDRVTRLARLLRDDLGLAPGEHAAALLTNRTEGVELIWAAILSGVWLTPINRHLAPDEIDYVIADSHARVLIADAPHAEAAARAAQRGVRVLMAGGELDAAIASASDAPLPPDGPAGANMIYTSGTTGHPKGVKRARAGSVAAALEAARAYGMRIGLDGAGPHLVTGPMYHAAPLMFAVYDQANGAPIISMPRFDAEHTLALIDARGVRNTHLVPTMFVRLLRLPEDVKQRFDLSSLSLVLHGAAPISADVKRRMIAWWGEVLVEYWGGTEGGVNTLIDSAEWLAHPGSVGRVLPNFEVFSVDDAGRRLPRGEVGTLYCRNRTSDRPFEYHGAPEKTAAAYLEPGVFTLGDVGRVDADGHVHLSDRQANMIISGGVNIYPAEIERVLEQHPAIADVGVFGIPHEEWGEEVKAAVELMAGHAPSPQLEREILGFARAQLAGYKVPRSIDFHTELPRTAAGKLVVRRLREPYWAGRDRHI